MSRIESLVRAPFTKASFNTPFLQPQDLRTESIGLYGIYFEACLVVSDTHYLNIRVPHHTIISLLALSAPVNCMLSHLRCRSSCLFYHLPFGILRQLSHLSCCHCLILEWDANTIWYPSNHPICRHRFGCTWSQSLTDRCKRSPECSPVFWGSRCASLWASSRRFQGWQRWASRGDVSQWSC